MKAVAYDNCMKKKTMVARWKAIKKQYKRQICSPVCLVNINHDVLHFALLNVEGIQSANMYCDQLELSQAVISEKYIVLIYNKCAILQHECVKPVARNLTIREIEFSILRIHVTFSHLKSVNSDMVQLECPDNDFPT